MIEALNRCPNRSFDVETGERRRLADEAPMDSIHLDGRHVAFADGEREYEIWVMEDYLPGEISAPGQLAFLLHISEQVGLRSPP